MAHVREVRQVLGFKCRTAKNSALESLILAASPETCLATPAWYGTCVIYSPENKVCRVSWTELYAVG